MRTYLSTVIKIIRPLEFYYTCQAHARSGAPCRRGSATKAVLARSAHGRHVVIKASAQQRTPRSSSCAIHFAARSRSRRAMYCDSRCRACKFTNVSEGCTWTSSSTAVVGSVGVASYCCASAFRAENVPRQVTAPCDTLPDSYSAHSLSLPPPSESASLTTLHAFRAFK